MTHRLTWTDLPASVHDRVERLLGEPIVATRSCTGGVSPSTAEVVTGASGASLFVKAVRERDNPDSITLNRTEARALARIPADAPVPALVDVFEDGPWLVLVTEAAPGATPPQPWEAGHLDAVLVALDALQQAATPCPVPDLPPILDTIGDDLRGFERVAADPPADLDPWLAERLDALCAASERGAAAHAGDTLCHADLRADNIVIGPAGQVALVDWAWACRGSRVVDAIHVLSSVDDPAGELDVSGRIDRVLARHGLDPALGADMLVALLGFFVDAARRPANPALPELQPHRRRRRDALLRLVRSRWDGATGAGRP